MRNFAAAWPDPEILQQLLQNLAWGHNLVLLDRLDDADTRRWYAQRAVTDGWSRAIPTDRITPTSSSSSRPQPSLRLTSPPNPPAIRRQRTPRSSISVLPRSAGCCDEQTPAARSSWRRTQSWTILRAALAERTLIFRDETAVR